MLYNKENEGINKMKKNNFPHSSFISASFVFDLAMCTNNLFFNVLMSAHLANNGGKSME